MLVFRNPDLVACFSFFVCVLCVLRVCVLCVLRDSSLFLWVNYIMLVIFSVLYIKRNMDFCYEVHNQRLYCYCYAVSRTKVFYTWHHILIFEQIVVESNIMKLESFTKKNKILLCGDPFEAFFLILLNQFQG